MSEGGRKIDASKRIARRLAVLRDVERSGGYDRWSHLSSRGHHYSTVLSCVFLGFLNEPSPYHYELTDLGKRELQRGTDV